MPASKYLLCCGFAYVCMHASMHAYEYKYMYIVSAAAVFALVYVGAA